MKKSSGTFNYSLLYTKNAVKEINKLDSVAKRRLKSALEKLCLDPKERSKKLVASGIGQYRYRIGNYRAIFDIEGNNIVIVKVGHRSDIYKH